MGVIGGSIAARRIAIAALVLWTTTLVIFWPGYALYDSVAQYRQAVSAQFDDWHPPIMVMLWRALHLTVGGGAGPMLAVQLGGWWLGLGSIATGLARRGQAHAGVAVLAVGLMPPLLGWQVAVLKDAQLAAALVSATGLVAWWRLDGRAMPLMARIGVAIVLIYATLVRANAVFAVAPFVAGVLAGASWRRRTAIAAAVIVAGLAIAGPINHDLLGAARSGVERTQATYDLVGIAVRASTDTPGITTAERSAVVTKQCASSYFWDALGDETRCGRDLVSMRNIPPTMLYRDLATAAATHPLAYLAHRATHLNSTERWLVPAHWPGTAPPASGEPSRLNLGDPGTIAHAWQRLGASVVETPFGWPICWVVVALGALLAAVRGSSEMRSLVAALAASAVVMEASFAAISIASDLRYHLWSMTASALAAVLVLAEGRPSPRVWRPIAVLLTLVIVAGTMARATLPTPPQTYAGMLRGG